MITFEQVKLLKDAGWKFKHCQFQIFDEGQRNVCRNTGKCNGFIVDGLCYSYPDEKEMMESLKGKVDVTWDIQYNEWVIKGWGGRITHPDLTEALVRACCVMMKDDK